jgi:hypothetical protein
MLHGLQEIRAVVSGVCNQKAIRQIRGAKAAVPESENHRHYRLDQFPDRDLRSIEIHHQKLKSST